MNRRALLLGSAAVLASRAVPALPSTTVMEHVTLDIDPAALARYIRGTMVRVIAEAFQVPEERLLRDPVVVSYLEGNSAWGRLLPTPERGTT